MITDIKEVSLVIPSYNNLNHLKNAYRSIRDYYNDLELVLIDDGSSDGTFEWIESLNDSNVISWKEESRVGHTILYDKGIEATEKPVVGILHADMYIGPHYLENLLKHLKKGRVVCATRVEPPLHPPGKEKIIKDFGQDFDSLDIKSFYKFVVSEQDRSKNKTTRGMFAPWILYKEDFIAIGGHDWGFAPFPYEDSDVFQRWILNGYEMIQSRDSLVYHLTCRGHRWTEEIGKDTEEYEMFRERARKHYLKKWGSWIENDEWGHPIITPVYRKKLTMKKPNVLLEDELGQWFNNLGDDIEVIVDPDNFSQQDFQHITLLNKIIKDSGKVGSFKLGNLEIIIRKVEEIQHTLIKV